MAEHVGPDLRAVLEAADGEGVEPKGTTTLCTRGATIVQKPTNKRTAEHAPGRRTVQEDGT